LSQLLVFWLLSRCRHIKIMWLVLKFQKD